MQISPRLIEQVNQIFVQLFEVDPEDLSPEAHLFDDLGLDSIDAIDLVISFEKEFKIKPKPEEVQEIRTMNHVYQLVARYYQARQFEPESHA